jgi:dihydrodipicolinate synthase/N-acetylneuraminate lyase
MRREECRGIWVPLVTPFDSAGDLDVGAIAPIVDWLLERGVHGLLALGTTGEAAHCSEDEADAVVAAVVRAARRRVPVLAGSGRASTRATIAASKRFAAAGASGVLVLTPAAYRARMDGDALRRHYAAVADASPVPVFVYHIPEATGLDLDPTVLAAILAHPNAWGFKDSSTVDGPLAATLGLVATPAIAFVGAAPRVVAGLEAGAAGGILAVANVVPEACVALEAAWRRGDRAAATRWQERIAGVAAAWTGAAAAAAIKQALRAEGLPAGQPRAPLVDAPPSVRAALAAARAACRPPLDPP